MFSTSTAIPGRVKIGRTDRTDSAIRATEIGIALPGTTRQDWITGVEDSSRVERSVHAACASVASGAMANGLGRPSRKPVKRSSMRSTPTHSRRWRGGSARRIEGAGPTRSERSRRQRREKPTRDAVESEAGAEDRRRLHARIAAAVEARHAFPEGRAASERERWKMSAVCGFISMPIFGWLAIFFLIESADLHWLAAVAITFASLTLIARALAFGKCPSITASQPSIREVMRNALSGVRHRAAVADHVRNHPFWASPAASSAAMEAR